MSACAARQLTISPPYGQSGPTVQKAGHVEHPVGACAASKMRSWPCLNFSLDVMRVESLYCPSASQFELSTLRMNEPESVVYARPLSCELCLSWKLTIPCVGSLR